MADTTNYSWTKPTVNADDGTWGGVANGLADAVDASLKTVEDAIAGRLLASGSVALATDFLVLDLSAYSAYKHVVIEFENVGFSATATLTCTASIDAGANYLATLYSWATGLLTSSYVFNSSSSDSSINLASSTTTGPINGRYNIYGLNGVGFWIDGEVTRSGTIPLKTIASGRHTSTAVNALKFTLTGAATSGTYRVIGYK